MKINIKVILLLFSFAVPFYVFSYDNMIIGATIQAGSLLLNLWQILLCRQVQIWEHGMT